MFFNKKINLESVLVCIGKKEENETFTIPFIDNLILYFVSEKKASFDIISKQDFKKMNISIKELLAIAKKNVKERIFRTYKEIPIRRNEKNQVIIPFDAEQIINMGKYNFWTSIVLIDDFWNKDSSMCIEKNWNKYYIGIPYRTFLLIGNADNNKSKNEINNLIENYIKEDKNELLGFGDYEAAKRDITNNTYIIENGKIISNNSKEEYFL